WRAGGRGRGPAVRPAIANGLGPSKTGGVDGGSTIRRHRPMASADVIVRLLLAAGLGAAIGLEREIRQKPAGLRTNILMAVGSALFSLASIAMVHYEGTSDRIAANIVTGVGFLGGGAILRGDKG